MRTTSARNDDMTLPTAATWHPLLPLASVSVTCALLGHKVHHTIVGDRNAACARCGAPILIRDQSLSRIAHTLSCFFGSHHYVSITRRSAHNEYVCERCGHPLLTDFHNEPYSTRNRFKKRVNYRCGLLGHHVYVVEGRSGTTEYVCRCGHSFLKRQSALTMIRHPLACVLGGHLLGINELRGDWAEYVCVRCGHPFCFKLATSHVKSDSEKPIHV